MFQWISSLVRDKPDQASERQTSKMGLQVQTHYHCGYERNNRLIFSAEDKRRLRQLVIDELGIDAFATEQLPAERLEMAKYHHNEKLAAKTAGNNQLLLNSADGVIRINNKEIHLYPECIVSAGLLCDNSSINTVEHQTILVIENLAIMPLCHRWLLPLSDQQALWIYRGDHKSGSKAQACQDFLERFGKDKTIIVFSDMDPKGLEIAATLPYAKFWLGPCKDSWRTLLKSRFASQSGFDMQSVASEYLLRLSKSNLLSEPFTKLLSVMREERSSFRQEHTYSHNVALELIPIKVKDNC
jgi:hypothetical protein